MIAVWLHTLAPRPGHKAAKLDNRTICGHQHLLSDEAAQCWLVGTGVFQLLFGCRWEQTSRSPYAAGTNAHQGRLDSRPNCSTLWSTRQLALSTLIPM